MHAVFGLRSRRVAPLCRCRMCRLLRLRICCKTFSSFSDTLPVSTLAGRLVVPVSRLVA